MHFKTVLSKMWSSIQLYLFPLIEGRCGNLSNEYKELLSILELVRIEEYLPCTQFNNGRPPLDRAQIARAFVAKMFLKIPDNKQLVNRLKIDSQLKAICGWNVEKKIPSESKFSRAFKEFASMKLPDKVHQALIKEVYKDTIIGHIVRDSVPIEAREIPLVKGSVHERKKIKNERQKLERNGALNRRQKQLTQDLDMMIDELPKACDLGRKRSAKGCGMSWKGYKLHVAIDDHCVPIATILTSASINDCEAGIPLGTKAQKVVKNFYDLMDAAYDVPEINQHSLSMGHVPIIAKCARGAAQKEELEKDKQRNKLLNFSTAERNRYKTRFSKERFNALYKDSFGGRRLLHKGHEKSFCHVMFGVLALAGMLLVKLSL